MCRLMPGFITILLLLTAVPPLHAALQCPLHVSDLSGVEAPWPLVGGVAIPQGHAQGPENVRVLDAAGNPVEAQIDIATTYRDGSARWALVSMMAPVDGEYVAEIGPDVAAASVQGGISLSPIDGGYRVDTGAAVFTVTQSALVPHSAEIAGRVLFAPGEAVAYAADNRERRAVAAGPAAGIEVSVLREGPIRTILRTEGDYVLDDGTRIARGICIMEFFAGSAMVKMTHSFILTENTNELWFRDYGITVPVGAQGDAVATFDTDRAFDETVRRVPLAAGDSAAITQVEFPHFGERDSLFELFLFRGNRGELLESGEACGEWADLARGDLGLTVAVKDFAEQFPKGYSATHEALTVHLWPERSGREMDFRAETLVRDYWRSWADQAPGGAEALAAIPSNAQAARKTHQLWLMPRVGNLDVTQTARRAHAVTEPVLLQCDPEFLCDSGALPWPLQPKDTGQFPEEEALISDFWERTTFGYRVFPMTGFIAWGMNPYLQYRRDSEGRWQAGFYRLSQMVDYGLRRHVWTLYARSGERRYYDYGSRFNTFAGDWEMQHLDVEGEDGLTKMRGAFSYGDIHKPFYWGTETWRYTYFLLRSGISGHDSMNWLLEYYMTGNEHALETAQQYGDAFKRHWDLQETVDGSAPFIILRVITALYTHDWDAQLGEMARELAHRLMLPENPNGLYEDMPYGPLYKVDRNAAATYDYWWATGDELAREVFLQALDYEYRFNRIPSPIEYQNGKAFLYTLAYNMTGREVYRQIAAQLVRSALNVEGERLAEEIGDTDPHELDGLPFRGPHLNMHPTLGIPTALTLLAQAEQPIAPYPLLVKAFNAERARGVFNKPANEPLTLQVYLRTMRTGEIEPEVFGPDERPVECAIQSEERIPSYSPSQFRHFSYRIEVPAGAPAGTYTLGVGGPEEFIVQEADTEQVALACPNGFWLGAGGSSAGERMYFNVPEGTATLELFLGRPLTLFAPDGSVALEASEDNIGDISVPVEGRTGAWSVICAHPAHIKLRNVPPMAAYASPERLLSGTVSLPAMPVPELPSPEERFVEGVVGQALQLASDETLQFPRGAPVEDGGYEHFPAEEGTIELWFRPNRASNEIAFRHRQLHRLNFVAGGAISFLYRYGQGPVEHNLYSYVDLLTLGDLNGDTGHIGGHARHFWQRGEWVHLAATWRIFEGNRGTEGEFDVYIDGQRMEPTWNYPRSLTGRTSYVLNEVAEQIRIGGFDGTIDELRISNIRRYEEDFQPPRASFAPDANTLALFSFDGNTEGVSGVTGVTGQPIVAE